MSLPLGFELLSSLAPSLVCELFTFEKTYLPHTVPITLFSTRLFTRANLHFSSPGRRRWREGRQRGRKVKMRARSYFPLHHLWPAIVGPTKGLARGGSGPCRKRGSSGGNVLSRLQTPPLLTYRVPSGFPACPRDHRSKNRGHSLGGFAAEPPHGSAALPARLPHPHLGQGRCGRSESRTDRRLLPTIGVGMSRRGFPGASEIWRAAAIRKEMFPQAGATERTQRRQRGEGPEPLGVDSLCRAEPPAAARDGALPDIPRWAGPVRGSPRHPGLGRAAVQC